MRVKDAIGRYGEQVAVDHLVAAGLVIVCRNWRCAEGEVDAVARDGQALVFVEVKTRSSTAFGLPAEAVDRIKRARLRGVALAWIAAHRDDEPRWREVRFDVVAVLRRPNGPPVVTHVRAAF